MNGRKKLFLVLFLLFAAVSIKIIVSSYHEFKENFEQKNIRILNLVLYSCDNGGPYDKMKDITYQYYKTFPFLTTYYYRFDPELISDFEIRNSVLHIKGEESYIPGILKKTLDAFEYFEKDLHNYDYVVRSNISTIIRFDKLREELIENRTDYGCSLCWGVDATHPIASENTIYSSGTSMIFSSNMLLKILQNKEFVDETLIDDVSIGKLITERIPDVELKPVFKNEKNHGFHIVPDMKKDRNKIINFTKDPSIVFFRNNNEDREVDVHQMDIIVKTLRNKTI